MDELKDIFRLLRTGDLRSSQERGRLIGEGVDFPVAKTTTVRTIANFEVECRLRGRIRLKEAYATGDKHLWEKDYERVCRKFNDQIFRSVVLGAWHFFALSWKKVTNELGTVEQPVVLLCESSNKDGGPYIKVLENDGSLVNAAKGKEIVTHGRAVRWKVEFEHVEWGLWDEKVIERNYSMLHLPPKVLETMNGDVRYKEYEEALAVAALKRRLEIQQVLLLGQTEQQHGGDSNWFTVKTTGVAGKLRISWMIKGGWSDARLSGYRVVGSRFPEPIKDANGKPTSRLSGEEIVIDSREDSHVDLHIGQGVECGFSFVLVKKADGLFDSPTVDQLNFRVRMPTAEETDSLKALALDINQSRKVETNPDPIQEKVERVVSKARGALRVNTTLMSEREKAKREVREMPEFKALNGDEQADVLERVDEIFRPLWDEV